MLRETFSSEYLHMPYHKLTHAHTGQEIKYFSLVNRLPLGRFVSMNSRTSNNSFKKIVYMQRVRVAGAPFDTRV